MNQKNEDGNLLPIENYNEVPTVESRIIAEKLGNEHRALLQLIGTHEKTIENHFGPIAFEMMKSEKQSFMNGRHTRVAHLTEEQATFVATLSKNTEKTVELKALIVKSFFAYRQLAATAILQLELIPLVEKAVAIVGSKAKLAARMNINAAIFTHIYNNPHLVSTRMLSRIESVCSDIIANGIGVDPELVELLLKVDNKEAREGLYRKFMGGRS